MKLAQLQAYFISLFVWEGVTCYVNTLRKMLYGETNFDLSQGIEYHDELLNSSLHHSWG